MNNVGQWLYHFCTVSSFRTEPIAVTTRQHSSKDVNKLNLFVCCHTHCDPSLSKLTLVICAEHELTGVHCWYMIFEDINSTKVPERAFLVRCQVLCLPGAHSCPEDEWQNWTWCVNPVSGVTVMYFSGTSELCDGDLSG